MLFSTVQLSTALLLETTHIDMQEMPEYSGRKLARFSRVSAWQHAFVHFHERQCVTEIPYVLLQPLIGGNFSLRACIDIKMDL